MSLIEFQAPKPFPVPPSISKLQPGRLPPPPPCFSCLSREISCVCSSNYCVDRGMLTSREGGWKAPGVSLRRSEERRRLRLLREDSEISHSLPREAELCHYKRNHSQLVPLNLNAGSSHSQSHLWGILPVSSPSPPDSKVSPLLIGYLRSSGSGAFSGPQKAIHGTSAGRRRQVRGQLRWGDA